MRKKLVSLLALVLVVSGITTTNNASEFKTQSLVMPGYDGVLNTEDDFTIIPTNGNYVRTTAGKVLLPEGGTVQDLDYNNTIKPGTEVIPTGYYISTSSYDNSDVNISICGKEGPEYTVFANSNYDLDLMYDIDVTPIILFDSDFLGAKNKINVTNEMLIELGKPTITNPDYDYGDVEPDYSLMRSYVEPQDLANIQAGVLGVYPVLFYITQEVIPSEIARFGYKEGQIIIEGLEEPPVEAPPADIIPPVVPEPPADDIPEVPAPPTDDIPEVPAPPVDDIPPVDPTPPETPGTEEPTPEEPGTQEPGTQEPGQQEPSVPSEPEVPNEPQQPVTPQEPQTPSTGSTPNQEVVNETKPEDTKKEEVKTSTTSNLFVLLTVIVGSSLILINRRK